MRSKLFICTMLFLAPGVLLCQQTPTIAQMKQMLDVSQRRSQLNIEGTTPFHLVASFQAFDGKGSPIGKGTIDELWKNPRQYRETLVLPAMKRVTGKDGKEGFVENFHAPPRELTEVDSGTQLWRTGEWVLFDEVGNGIVAVLQPFSFRSNTSSRLSRSNTSSRLSYEAPAKENADLECIGTEPDIPGLSEDTRLALTTYCLNKGNHLLRLISRPNAVGISFNDVEPFGKKYIARSVAVQVGNVVRLKLHIDVLEAATGFSSLDIPPPATAQLLPFHRADVPFVSGELMRGQLLKAVNPDYLRTAFQGNVLVKVHIDTTGAVESAEVVRSDNRILKAPLLEAVKQWRYRVSYQGNKVVAVDQEIGFVQMDRDNTQ